MKRLIFALSLIALPAQAETIEGQITAHVIGGGANNTFDTRSCVFWQIDQVDTWYAISSTDGNYRAEADFILLHANDGAKITFYTSSVPVCGMTGAGGLSRYPTK